MGAKRPDVVRPDVVCLLGGDTAEMMLSMVVQMMPS